MHVLICGFSGAVLGGIETYVLNMNEHMSEGCVFDYILEQDLCLFEDRINKKGGKIFYVPNIRKNPTGYLRGFWRVLGEQKKEGTRILYYQLFSMAKLLPAFLAKIRGYKVVLHAHNNGLQKSGKCYVLTHKLGRLLARPFRFIHFTNSQLSSDFMFGKCVKSELIYNAIDLERFSYDLAIRNNVRTQLKCGSNVVVGFVGRLVRQKNPIFMLNVFSEFHKLCPNSELWIIGEGELKQSLLTLINEYKIESSVKWLGRRDDVNRIMQGMDILLQPSLFEGLGIVLVEAQATGLPVIASKGVIPEEVVVTNRIQMVSLEERASSWAESCIELFKKCGIPSNRDGINIKDSFNINIEALRLESILRSINDTY